MTNSMLTVDSDGCCNLVQHSKISNIRDCKFYAELRCGLVAGNFYNTCDYLWFLIISY